MATKEEIQAVFAAYKSADEAVSEAKAAYEAAVQRRSETCKAILETTGSKGPYQFNGTQVKIVIRGDLHFLRGKNTAEVIEVD